MDAQTRKSESGNAVLEYCALWLFFFNFRVDFKGIFPCWTFLERGKFTRRHKITTMIPGCFPARRRVPLSRLWVDWLLLVVLTSWVSNLRPMNPDIDPGISTASFFVAAFKPYPKPTHWIDDPVRNAVVKDAYANYQRVPVEYPLGYLTSHNAFNGKVNMTKSWSKIQKWCQGDKGDTRPMKGVC